MALDQQKLRFSWAGLVSTTSCESSIMERNIIPAPEELSIQGGAHQFPQLISSIWMNSSPREFPVHLPGCLPLATERLRTYLRSFRKTWSNTLRWACHIHRTLGVFLDSLEPWASSSKDILDPGYALLFGTLKAWWKLSVLIMTLEGYWEIFCPTKCKKVAVPRAGKVSVCTMLYYMLFLKKREKQIDNDILRCRSFFFMGLRLTLWNKRSFRVRQARFHFLFHYLLIQCCWACYLISLHISVL